MNIFLDFSKIKTTKLQSFNAAKATSSSQSIPECYECKTGQKRRLSTTLINCLNVSSDSRATIDQQRVASTVSKWQDHQTETFKTLFTSNLTKPFQTQGGKQQLSLETRQWAHEVVCAPDELHTPGNLFSYWDLNSEVYNRIRIM